MTGTGAENRAIPVCPVMTIPPRQIRFFIHFRACRLVNRKTSSMGRSGPIGRPMPIGADQAESPGQSPTSSLLPGLLLPIPPRRIGPGRMAFTAVP